MKNLIENIDALDNQMTEIQAEIDSLNEDMGEKEMAHKEAGRAACDAFNDTYEVGEKIRMDLSAGSDVVGTTVIITSVAKLYDTRHASFYGHLEGEAHTRKPFYLTDIANAKAAKAVKPKKPGETKDD